MNDICLFKAFYSCSDNEKLQTSKSDGDREANIIEPSKNIGDNLSTKLQENQPVEVKYHKSCVSKYLIKGKRLSEKKKRAACSSGPVQEKRTRSITGPPFDWLTLCFYCSRPCNVDQDPRNPNRWIPAYLVRETEEKKRHD